MFKMETNVMSLEEFLRVQENIYAITIVSVEGLVCKIEIEQPKDGVLSIHTFCESNSIDLECVEGFEVLTFKK